MARLITSTGLLLFCACVAAPPEIPPGENPLRWQGDIEAFERTAAVEPPPADAVLFVGSSSIRRWKTLHADMQPLPVIQRGFGGSRLFDSIYWADRLILAYAPAVIVMFSVTNDIAGKEPKSPAAVGSLFEQFVTRIRSSLPHTPIVYIAINPTRARIQHLDLVLETNALIASLCAQDRTLYFVDTASSLLDSDGRPDQQWFVNDQLHLNERGYASWTEQLKPLITRLQAEAVAR